MIEEAEWQHRLHMQLRWNDFDRYRHVNHAIYHVFLAESRVALIELLVGRAGMEFVLVRVEVDFRNEVGLEESAVDVVARVTDLGVKSVTIAQQLLVGDGTVAVECVSVVAAWDGGERAARPLSARERELLQPSG